MSVVVCGSVAYDYLMEFDGEFGDLLLKFLCYFFIKN